MIARALRRIPHPPLSSRRGLFIVFILVAAFGAAFTIGTVVAVQWTETADFCGRCHTMGPELKAYEMSPHREVACVECHTEPGTAGWVKAKMNGTKQLFQVLTGTFPRPIPAPDHALLPPTSLTCLKCHDIGPLIANGGPIKLVLQNRYQPDETTTRDAIALVVRPFGFGSTPARSSGSAGSSGHSSAGGGSSAAGGGSSAGGAIGAADGGGGAGEDATPRGVHWHIASDVEYAAADERAQKIDYVAIVEPTGEREEFIAAEAVTVSSDVAPDIERLRSGGLRRMDCIDCHNRVGHGVPGIDESIDDRIDSGEISTQLPWIKREASDRLSAEYASEADANRAIAGLRDFYAQRYPLVAAEQRTVIDNAITSLRTIYRLVATPDMRVTQATYPNNIGHQTAPGCFRCHDGAHYKVVNGALSGETIPSQCATCHTFPQIGSIESGVLIGQRPASHNDRLWVFDHKTSVTSDDPANQSCGACHTRTYCQNCHQTPAVKVSHDGMVLNHANVARQVGAAACAYCHQPAYCAQCHSDEVLPVGPAGSGQTGALRHDDAAALTPP